MVPFLGSALWTTGPLALATTVDAWFVYAGIAWFLGLLAWSKYNEPALASPYPVAAPVRIADADAAPAGNPATRPDRP